jgi:hypothetical protein
MCSGDWYPLVLQTGISSTQRPRTEATKKGDVERGSKFTHGRGRRSTTSEGLVLMTLGICMTTILGSEVILTSITGTVGFYCGVLAQGLLLMATPQSLNTGCLQLPRKIASYKLAGTGNYILGAFSFTLAV